jgi:hypothetical protein
MGDGPIFDTNPGVVDLVRFVGRKHPRVEFIDGVATTYDPVPTLDELVDGVRRRILGEVAEQAQAEDLSRRLRSF